jgi:hypothetical protein
MIANASSWPGSQSRIIGVGRFAAAVGLVMSNLLLAQDRLAGGGAGPSQRRGGTRLDNDHVVAVGPHRTDERGLGARTSRGHGLVHAALPPTPVPLDAASVV